MATTRLRSIRIDDDEWTAWGNEAERRGLSITQLIRLCVLEHAFPVEAPSAPKKDALSKAPAAKGKKQAKPKVEADSPAPVRYAPPAPTFGSSNPRPFKPLSKSDQSARSRRKD